MPTAVLFSSGLDSAVLAVHEARHDRVHPVYVSTGLAWEAEERRSLDALLADPAFRALEPVAQLTFSVRDVYPETHWAIRGEPPDFDTPDVDVYLTGRNIALLSKTAIHCARNAIDRIALGPLAGNPFPDATPEFFAAMTRALSLGLAHDLVIDTPFGARTKSEVIRIGVGLGVPLAATLSCMRPRDGLHCGRCSKCRERRDAFRAAGVVDETRYAAAPVR